MVFFLTEPVNYSFLHQYNLSYQCDSSNQCHHISTIFPPGEYIFELWGGQGGCSAEDNGGKGGYTSANVTFIHSSKVFINIGAKGICSSKDLIKTGKTFNGGGESRYNTGSNDIFYGCSGGGATDIRISSNALRNRILVAGGGGGSGADLREDTFGYYEGGYGGGEIGGNGELGLHSKAQAGNGATQSQPGNETHPGYLGIGGNSNGSSGGGGGGGYYGGGGAGASGSGGGGGSGYIAPSSNNYIITKNLFLSGNCSIPKFDGNGTSIGNSGHGAVKITVIRQEYSAISYKFKYPSIQFCSSLLIIYILSPNCV